MGGPDQLNLLYNALANTCEGVVITDAVLDKPGPKILFANPAFYKMTGYVEEEVLGKCPRFLQGPRTGRNEKHKLRSDLESGSHYHGQLVNYRKDGKSFQMDLRISPLQDAEGRITHYVAIQHDVKETEQNEQIRQRQQAERLEAIGRVTGEIAHDFSNLLVGILGFAQLLKGELPDGGPESNMAAEIIRTAERAHVLTRQLLSFSRDRPGERTNIDLREAVKQIEALLLRLVGDSISTRILVEDEGCIVRATMTEVEHIVINLVTNARDAMPEGGELQIHMQPKELKSHETEPHGAKAGKYVELRVSDTGVGMDEQTRSKIFEPFFTTKDEGRGTGLGLANVFQQVRKLDGMITVESELRRGSHFRVYFPAAGVEA